MMYICVNGGKKKERGWRVELRGVKSAVEIDGEL